MNEEPRTSTLERVYQGTIVEGGPPVLIFAFASLAAVIVGVASPGGGLAIMALGVLGAMLINFVDTRPGRGESQPGEPEAPARRRKSPATEAES
jgi:hypothetical protein